MDVPLPITGKSSQAIIRALERTEQEIRRSPAKADTDQSGAVMAPTVVIRFLVPPDQESFGRGSVFGACYELASLLVGEKFRGIRTVAYFPQSIKGHVLLVALACGERIAGDDIELGEAGIDEQEISPTQREAYQEIARRRLSVPIAVVDKLLDPQTTLIQAETEIGVHLVSPAEMEKLRETETFAEEPTVLIPAGQSGLFTADAARRINLVNRIARDRTLLAMGLGFRPEELKIVRVASETGCAIQVNVSGLMTNDKAGAVIRSLKAVFEPINSPNPAPIDGSKVDLICLCIDSPGGHLEASLSLANYLVASIDPARVKTVAYIPYQARSDAALIAVACNEIVLGPGAVLGGDGAKVFSKTSIADARQTIRDFLAPETGIPWSLPVGFVDPDMEIYRMTRQGRPVLVDYFCEEERDSLPDARRWTKGQVVKPAGTLLGIVEGKGEQLLVDRTVADFSELKLLYDLHEDPITVGPGLADRIVRILSRPEVSSMLLMLIFFAIIIEANSPGIGIGAFVAVMGIILFFWLNFLGGTAGWLEVLLFIVGGLCVLLEVFVLPGFGVFGIGGALTVIASLVLASQTFIIPQNSYQLGQFRTSLLILIAAGAGVTVFGCMLSNALNRNNRPKNTNFIRETEKMADYDSLLGRLGKTLTPLVPAGKASIDGEPINVVSDGELIEKGVQVEVVQVVGYRVVVRQF